VFVAKIAELPTARARALTNAALYVPRESLPDIGEEEFYLADLIGLAALAETGEAFGCVVDVLNSVAVIFWKSRVPAAARQFFCRSRKRYFAYQSDVGSLTIVPPIETEAKPACPES